MAHMVICSKCGKSFDRDRIQAVKTGARRYAHYDCVPEGELVPLKTKEQEKIILEEKLNNESKSREEKNDETEDLRKLTDYIQQLYGKNNVNWPLIMKQIQTFKKDYGYTYSGMLKSLVYFYNIKNNPINLVKGIGIIPYAYKDAYNYYYSLFITKNQNEQKDIQKMTTQIKEITIKPPSISKPKRFFNLNEEDDINE